MSFFCSHTLRSDFLMDDAFEHQDGGVLRCLDVMFCFEISKKSLCFRYAHLDARLEAPLREATRKNVACSDESAGSDVPSG